jgi:hypothetical protein
LTSFFVCFCACCYAPPPLYRVYKKWYEKSYHPFFITFFLGHFIMGNVC